MSSAPLPEPSPHAAAARAEVARLAAEARAAAQLPANSAEDFAREAEAALERFPVEAFTPGSTLPRAVTPASTPTFHILPPPDATSDPRPPTSDLRPPSSVLRLPLWGLAMAAGVVLAAGLMLRPLLFRGDDQLRDGPLRVTKEGRIADPAGLPAELVSVIEDAVRSRSASGFLGLGDALRGGSLTDLPGAAIDLAINGTNALTGTVATVLLAPAAGATLEDERPEFRWGRVAEAATYVVKVEAPASGEVLESPALPASELSWRPPQALARGEIYRWSVQAFDADRRVRSASSKSVLKILSAADTATLQQIRRTHGRSHLVLSAAYARLGMDTEARRELAELAKEEPDSALAKELAASVREERK